MFSLSETLVIQILDPLDRSTWVALFFFSFSVSSFLIDFLGNVLNFILCLALNFCFCHHFFISRNSFCFLSFPFSCFFFSRFMNVLSSSMGMKNFFKKNVVFFFSPFNYFCLFQGNFWFVFLGLSLVVAFFKSWWSFVVHI